MWDFSIWGITVVPKMHFWILGMLKLYLLLTSRRRGGRDKRCGHLPALGKVGLSRPPAPPNTCVRGNYRDHEAHFHNPAFWLSPPAVGTSTPFQVILQLWWTPAHVKTSGLVVAATVWRLSKDDFPIPYKTGKGLYCPDTAAWAGSTVRGTECRRAGEHVYGIYT